MKQKQGDIFLEPADCICIPTTNHVVNGKAVLETETSKMANIYFGGLDEKIGKYISEFGNKVHIFTAQNLNPHWRCYMYDGKLLRYNYVVVFPIADTQLWDELHFDVIARSLKELNEFAIKWGWKKITFPYFTTNEVAYNLMREALNDRFVLLTPQLTAKEI